MIVKYKSIYKIDYEREVITEGVAPDDFNQFIEEMINYVSANRSIRKFQPHSQTTQVVNCTKEIVSCAINTPENIIQVKDMFHDIADKLLRVEIATQERIAQTGQQVKRGSLIQALLYSENEQEYTYIITKVEHLGFFDEEDYRFKSGFPRDQRNIWKSCVFEITINDEGILVDAANIYLQRKAAYWAIDFLELKEMIDDESNTKLAFKWIESTLIHNVKQQAPSDYLVLRNAVIGYLRTPQHIDYDIMIDTIFSDYVPIDLTEDLLRPIKEKLITLPSTRNFDRQFTSAPNVIKAKIRKIYQVNEGIEIKLTGHIDDFKNTIQSVETVGERYIKIKTDNDEVFRTFMRT